MKDHQKMEDCMEQLFSEIRMLLVSNAVSEEEKLARLQQATQIIESSGVLEQ